MKIVSSLIASLVAAGTAQAAVVNYNFTLVTERIDSCYFDDNDNGAYVCLDVYSARMGDGAVSGWLQPGIGRFSYDTETPLNPDYQPPAPIGGTRVSYSGPAAMNDLSVLFPNSGASFQSDRARYAPTIEVADDEWGGSGNKRDLFRMGFTRSLGDNAIESVSFAFGGSVAATTGSGIPSTLSGFRNEGDFYFQRREASGVWFGIRGFITSRTLPVPEPETYAMLLAGLGMLAWRRKRAGPHPR